MMLALTEQEIENLANSDVELAVRLFKDYMVKNHTDFMSYYYPEIVVSKNIEHMLNHRQIYMAMYHQEELFSSNPMLMAEINLPWVKTNKQVWLEKNRPDLLNNVVTSDTINSFIKAMSSINF
jgi:hypothetical protein